MHISPSLHTHIGRVMVRPGVITHKDALQKLSYHLENVDKGADKFIDVVVCVFRNPSLSAMME